MAKKPIFDNQNINLPEGKQYEINDEAISASVTEMNLLEGAVVGTVVNSKAVIYDAAGKVALSSLSPMATGTIIADATELTAAMNAVTGATGTNGVKLPVAIADEVITIINTDGANDLLVYPVLHSQINALGASNPFTVVSGMTATFVARSATLWYTAGMPSVVSGLTASGTELNVLGGVTAGMVTASKGLVVDASKDISALNDVGLVNLDAGSSGVAGSVDVFPTTAASGKTTITSTDNAGDTTTDVVVAAQAGARTITIPDGGNATSFIPQSTLALSLAEVDVLDGATAGAQVASKVVVADANINTGISKVTELHIGATGSEVQVNATPAEIDKAADLSTQIQTIVTSGAQTVTAGVQALYLNEDTTAINATIATAVAHQGLFLVKSGLEPAGANDHILTLTIGTFNGTNNVATFADIDDSLLIYFDAAGAGTVLVNTGTVVLS